MSPKLNHGIVVVAAALATLSTGRPGFAAWKSEISDVEKAAIDPRVAAALSAVNALDQSVINDDHRAFAALLANDLVVNNPQNSVSNQGKTAQLNASGKISYSKYDRVIEFAGVRGEMVVLMGEEIVTPKGSNPMAGKEMHRRFTDIWKNVGGKWVLSVRQATIMQPLPT